MLLMLPALLSALVLAAHFLRWANTPGVLVVLGLAALALVARRAWSLKLFQGMLLASPALWALMAHRVFTERSAEGRPYLRACLIFAIVAVFSAWSAVLLSRPKVQERFGR